MKKIGLLFILMSMSSISVAALMVTNQTARNSRPQEPFSNMLCYYLNEGPQWYSIGPFVSSSNGIINRISVASYSVKAPWYGICLGFDEDSNSNAVHWYLRNYKFSDKSAVLSGNCMVQTSTPYSVVQDIVIIPKEGQATELTMSPDAAFEENVKYINYFLTVDERAHWSNPGGEVDMESMIQKCLDLLPGAKPIFSEMR